MHLNCFLNVVLPQDPVPNNNNFIGSSFDVITWSARFTKSFSFTRPSGEDGTHPMVCGHFARILRCHTLSLRAISSAPYATITHILHHHNTTGLVSPTTPQSLATCTDFSFFDDTFSARRPRNVCTVSARLTLLRVHVIDTPCPVRSLNASETRT